MDGKKLAQLFRKSNRMIIKRDKDCFWVTDTYALVRMNTMLASDFIAKWNSYKSTDNIPLLEEDNIYDISYTGSSFIKNKDPIGKVLKAATADDLKDITLTGLSKIIDGEPKRIFKSGESLGLIDNKYLFIIDGLTPEIIKTKGKLSPLVLFDKDENTIGLIMPVRSKEAIKEELKSLAG